MNFLLDIPIICIDGTEFRPALAKTGIQITVCATTITDYALKGNAEPITGVALLSYAKHTLPKINDGSKLAPGYQHHT